ncbi:hypothetical protein [Chryseobacterium oncorhynchi]|uniref:Uncharacterized protein n=1 Tax=Chryseobacterium oncorhynchi TaxID=741074 RepID=A0A316WLF3_9FLAO|nr:hypothetical protein [Chryseobacterium oncorhynchi]PWN60008.1 hypothetical protein C1638_020800 [Chryseobacterium oncorhynchi]
MFTKNNIIAIFIWLALFIIWSASVLFIKNNYGISETIQFGFKSIIVLFFICISILVVVVIAVIVEINACKRKFFLIAKDYSDFLDKYFPNISFQEFYDLAIVREELYHKKENLNSEILMSKLKKISSDIHYSSNYDDRKKADELYKFFTNPKPITTFGKLILEKGTNYFNILFFTNK